MAVTRTEAAFLNDFAPVPGVEVFSVGPTLNDHPDSGGQESPLLIIRWGPFKRQSASVPGVEEAVLSVGIAAVEHVPVVPAGTIVPWMALVPGGKAVSSPLPLVFLVRVLSFAEVEPPFICHCVPVTVVTRLIVMAGLAM